MRLPKILVMTCRATGTIRDLDDKVFALIVKRITGVS